MSDTSREARESMRDCARSDRHVILAAYRAYGPMTPDECADRLGWGANPYRVRRRVSELKADAKLEESGETRKTASGRRAAVLRVVTGEKQMRFA